MPDRSLDWWKQALKDLEHAELSLNYENYEWACFACHQSIKKGIKAVHLYYKQEI